jgi:bifunctional DNase/RNase
LGSFALVLGERGGNRRLPIIIGGFEAQAIALEIEKIKPNRPMTHDLMVTLAERLGGKLMSVMISDLREGVFYSQLRMIQGEEEFEVDARPSDAIALAVRFGAPIFTFPNVLEEAGIIIQEADEAEDDDRDTDPELPSLEDDDDDEDSRAGALKRLYQLMDEAIAREDYERAAHLRDQIQKMEN